MNTYIVNVPTYVVAVQTYFCKTCTRWFKLQTMFSISTHVSHSKKDVHDMERIMFQHAKVFCKMWTHAVKIQAYVQEVNIISRYRNIYQDATSTHLFRHRYKYLPKYIPVLFEWCVCYVFIMMQIIFRREHLSKIQIYVSKIYTHVFWDTHMCLFQNTNTL